MASLEQAADIIIKKCLNIKKQEKVLIITDKNLKDIGLILQKAANADLVEIPVGKVHGEEPPKQIAEQMLNYNVIIMPTTMSLTHTNAVKNAVKKARAVTLPGITKEILERSIDVNYNVMEKQTIKLKQILDNGKNVHITTKEGTDIKFSIENRKATAGTGLIKNSVGNLPAGEAYIAPLENTANGKFVIDGSVLNFKIKNPITVVVKNGFAVKITGKHEAEKLKQTLESIKDKNAFNIAELGIGTNEKAVVTGNILEDEKAKQTCHIALGKNSSFGGKIDVPIHIDCIILKPTIFIDGKIIIKDGKIIS